MKRIRVVKRLYYSFFVVYPALFILSGVFHATANAYPHVAGAPKTPFDVDEDGKPEMLWWHDASGNAVIHFLSDNILERVIWAKFAGRMDPDEWRVAGCADMNRDGCTDIVWHNVFSNRVVVSFLEQKWYLFFRVNTDEQTLIGERGAEWTLASVGDLNQDGYADLLWRNIGTGVIEATCFDGDNEIQTESLPIQSSEVLGKALMNSGWLLMGTADFNNNQTLDLVWWNTGNGSLIAWENCDINQTNYIIDRIDPVLWRPVGFGDWNGDGKTDVLWRNQESGSLVVNFYAGANWSRIGAAKIGMTLPLKTHWHPVGFN